MIVGKNSIVLILLFFYGGNILAQLPLRKQNIVVDSLLSKSVTMDLPDKYRKNITKYDEGIFVDYLFPDGASIVIFQGALQKTPLLSLKEGYFPERVDTISNKVIYRGVMNGKAWREDHFEQVRIYYCKVPVGEIALYNSILDSANVLPYLLEK